jgi:hypothetical protein
MTKKKINKSQQIRDYKEKHPTVGPASISEALSKRGVKISAQFVSTVLSQAGMTDKKSPVHSAAKTLREEIGKTVADNNEPSVKKKDLIEVIELSNRMGGISALKDAIAIIEQLRSLNVKI